MVTGKEPPKAVHRFNAASPTKAGRQAASPHKTTGKAASRAGAKSAGKPTMKRTNTTPIEVSFSSNFGIALGNKLFKNEVFEKRITDV